MKRDWAEQKRFGHTLENWPFFKEMHDSIYLGRTCICRCNKKFFKSNLPFLHFTPFPSLLTPFPLTYAGTWLRNEVSDWDGMQLALSDFHIVQLRCKELSACYLLRAHYKSRRIRMNPKVWINGFCGHFIRTLFGYNIAVKLSRYRCLPVDSLRPMQILFGIGVRMTMGSFCMHTESSKLKLLIMLPNLIITKFFYLSWGISKRVHLVFWRML